MIPLATNTPNQTMAGGLCVVVNSELAENGACVHHWVIEPGGDAPKSPGVCLNCGESRTFSNYIELLDDFTKNRQQTAQKRTEEQRRADEAQRRKEKYERDMADPARAEQIRASARAANERRRQRLKAERNNTTGITGG